MREWQLNENSTRYDAITAGPSDDDLMKYWWAWAVVALVVGTASLILFLAIALSPTARKNPFNVYLLYLSIPDFVFSLSCGITCLLNAINGEYWAAWMCTFQQWYCVFGIGSNAWLNACVVRELYTMLRFSNQRRRYKSPTRVHVMQQALLVFLFIGFLGTWGAIEAPHWPYHAGAASGLACLPIEVDHASTLFFWLVFFPLFAGIPSFYIIFVTFQVWYYKLLPPTGKRRLLAVYFGRLILVFYVMWVPTLVLIFAVPAYLPSWAAFLSGLWSHLQGAVSMAVSLMKPDILKSVKQLLMCQCGKESSKSSRPARPEQTPAASHDVSDQKWPSQNSWCTNPQNPNATMEGGKEGEQKRVPTRSHKSMFSSRDMWPSSEHVSSWSQNRIISDDLSHVVEQVTDDFGGGNEVEDDKAKCPDEKGDEEAPLTTL